MGWVRVQSFAIGDKHGLWNKRFLILCSGQLYLMKSQEVRSFPFVNSLHYDINILFSPSHLLDIFRMFFTCYFD